MRHLYCWLINFEQILDFGLVASAILRNQRNLKTESKYLSMSIYFKRNIFCAYFSQYISKTNIYSEQNARPETDSVYRILSKSTRLVCPSVIIQNFSLNDLLIREIISSPISNALFRLSKILEPRYICAILNICYFQTRKSYSLMCCPGILNGQNMKYEYLTMSP